MGGVSDFGLFRSCVRTAVVSAALLAVLGVLFLSVGTALSYYVDALWFGSLGYADVFWTSLNLQAAVFTGFSVVTFLVFYGSFLALKPARGDDLGRDAPHVGALNSLRAFAIGDNYGDARIWNAARGNAIREGLKIRASSA